MAAPGGEAGKGASRASNRRPKRGYRVAAPGYGGQIQAGRLDERVRGVGLAAHLGEERGGDRAIGQIVYAPAFGSAKGSLPRLHRPLKDLGVSADETVQGRSLLF